jgi:hypothetical protein
MREELRVAIIFSVVIGQSRMGEGLGIRRGRVTVDIRLGFPDDFHFRVQRSGYTRKKKGNILNCLRFF